MKIELNTKQKNTVLLRDLSPCHLFRDPEDGSIGIKGIDSYQCMWLLDDDGLLSCYPCGWDTMYVEDLGRVEISIKE